jgi:hypothetical protein
MKTADRPPLRLASRTIAAVSFTSALTSNRNADPVSASAATFIPMDESPGDDVYSGTPHRCATPRMDFRSRPSARSRSSTYPPIR